MIIKAHMKKIMEMKVIKSSCDIVGLRDVLDTIESHVRALDCQGVNKEHFGAVLIPILEEKIPKDVRLEISRSMGKENWQLEKYLELLKIEVEARDNSAVDRKEEGNKEDEKTTPFTTELLMNLSQSELAKKEAGDKGKRAKRRTCAFCKKQHFSDQCRIITDVERRRGMVKANRLCFRCLRDNHMISECKSKTKCYRCKSSDHHTAICMAENQDSSNLLVAGEKNLVLLQTARAVISNVDETAQVGVRILFDSGSQRSYVTERIVKLLSLSPITKESVSLNTFWKK